MLLKYKFDKRVFDYCSCKSLCTPPGCNEYNNKLDSHYDDKYNDFMTKNFSEKTLSDYFHIKSVRKLFEESVLKSELKSEKERIMKNQEWIHPLDQDHKSKVLKILLSCNNSFLDLYFLKEIINNNNFLIVQSRFTPKYNLNFNDFEEHWRVMWLIDKNQETITPMLLDTYHQIYKQNYPSLFQNQKWEIKRT